MGIKENAKDIDVWTRGLFIIVYGIIFYLLFGLILLIVIFQFIMKLVTTNLNEPILEFSDSLTRYVSQILLYITFKSEERPFPFSPWPTPGNTANDDKTSSDTALPKRKLKGK